MLNVTSVFKELTLDAENVRECCQDLLVIPLKIDRDFLKFGDAFFFFFISCYKKQTCYG